MPPRADRRNGAAMLPEPEPAPATPDLAEVLRELVLELRRARGVEPELLQARDAARLAGVSTASWHRLVAAGLAPAPVRLAGSVRWRASELRRWIAEGCPSRAK